MNIYIPPPLHLPEFKLQSILTRLTAVLWLWDTFLSKRYWVHAPISLFLVLWTLPSIKVEVAVYMAAFWSTPVSCCSLCVSSLCLWASCLWHTPVVRAMCHCGQDALQRPDIDHNSLGVGKPGFTVCVCGKNDSEFGSHDQKGTKRHRNCVSLTCDTHKLVDITRNTDFIHETSRQVRFI